MAQLQRLFDITPSQMKSAIKPADLTLRPATVSTHLFSPVPAALLAALLCLPALCWLPVHAAPPAAASSVPAAGAGPVAKTGTGRQSIRLDAAQREGLKLQTASIAAATGTAWLASATVTVPPGRDMAVHAPVAGTALRLLVGIGDAVTPGSALLVYTSATLSEMRRQVREAQLALDIADNSLKREEVLFDEGLIPQSRLELTRNRQRVATATLNARQAELRAIGQTSTTAQATEDAATGTLRAPMGGTVIELSSAAGQRLEPGTAVVRIADTSSLQLDIRLSADKAASIRNGDAITVPTHEAAGNILGVARAVDPQMQSRARARVSRPGRLQVGETVLAEITASQPSGQARWLIPVGALIRHQGQNTVFISSATGVDVITVQIHGSTADRATVSGPLSADSRVVTGGVAALHALLQQDTP